jgi:hypothetical protein
MLNPVPRLLSLFSPTGKAAFSIALGTCVAALSGCQGLGSNSSQPKVRIIDVSPDAPEIDIYQNSSAIAYKLSYGTITSYVPVDPGAATTTAHLSGSRQMLTSSRATLASAGQYTVLIGNFSSSLQQAVLKDQSQPAPAGQMTLRFLNQAVRTGPVDLYLVPAGQKLTTVAPVVTHTAFGANTGYLNLPSGIYTLVILPAGTAPGRDAAQVLYSGAQITYASASASTIVLIDDRDSEEPGMQAILAPDYAPPGHGVAVCEDK